MAERVNGILKDEFYLDQTCTCVVHAKKATKNCNQIVQQQKITFIFRL